MKKLIVGAILAFGAGVAGIAGAGVAVANPQTTVDCSPCANRNGATRAADADAPAVPPWNALFAADPWGKFFDGTNGKLGDKKGAWESGVEAVNGGSWEKAFPPAP
jgi:hypothetical protein